MKYNSLRSACVWSESWSFLTTTIKDKIVI